MKRHHISILAGLVVTGLLLIPSLTWAVGARSGEQVTLAKGETHHGTLFAAGQNLAIEGDVDGDLICAGNTIVITGTVHGDVLCAGQTITVGGTVDGNVRVAGQAISVNGKVSRHVMAATQTFTLGSGARAQGDVGLLAQTATIDGPVGRDLYGAVQSLRLANLVGGSVDAQLQELSLGPNAHINGGLTYTSEKSLDVKPAQVGGKIRHHEPEAAQERVMSPRDEAIGWLSDRLYWTLATLAVAILLATLVPEALRRVTATMSRQPGASMGWGLAVIFVMPLALIILLLTVIGVPLALILTALWVLALATSGVFVSVAVGRWVTSRTDWDHNSMILAALLGVPITIFILGLPLIGGVLSLAAALWATGGLLLSLRSSRTAA